MHDGVCCPCVVRLLRSNIDLTTAVDWYEAHTPDRPPAQLFLSHVAAESEAHNADAC